MEKKRAQERFLLKKAANANLEVRAESEYQRLLRGRGAHKQQWKEWARIGLTKYEPEDEVMLKPVRKKLTDFIRSIN